jgi:hypothetical protein
MDGIQIGRLHCKHLSGFTGQFFIALAYLLKHCLETGSAKEPEYHFNAEIGLEGYDSTAAKKPREVGSRGIGRIQLSKRRDEQQNARAGHGLDIPYCRSGMLCGIYHCLGQLLRGGNPIS